MKTRRQFLKSSLLAAGAVAAGISLPNRSFGRSVAGVPLGNSDTSPKTDWSGYWISPAALKILSARSFAPKIVAQNRGFALASSDDLKSDPQPLPPEITDAAFRQRDLARAGIDRQIVQWPLYLGVDALLNPDDGRALWSAYNDDLAELVRANPARFFGLAAVPTSDISWAAAELERAHHSLGLIGATLPAGALQTREAADLFAPLFAVAQRYHSHIAIQAGPASASIPGQFALNAPEGDVPWLRAIQETAQQLAVAAITLTESDFLDPYPDVTLQIGSLGGASAVFAAWQAAWQGQTDSDDVERLRRLYFTTGSFGLSAHVDELAVRSIGVDRVLFGSDFPQNDLKRGVSALSDADLTGGERDQIFAGNGRDLFASKVAAAG